MDLAHKKARNLTKNQEEIMEKVMELLLEKGFFHK